MLHIEQRNSGYGPIQCRADNTEEGGLAPITVEESESINICDAPESSYGVVIGDLYGEDYSTTADSFGVLIPISFADCYDSPTDRSSHTCSGGINGHHELPETPIALESQLCPPSCDFETRVSPCLPGCKKDHCTRTTRGHVCGTPLGASPGDTPNNQYAPTSRSPGVQTDYQNGIRKARRSDVSPFAPIFNPIVHVSPDYQANLQPTWRGFIENIEDALMIIEGCLNGILTECRRRPRMEERSRLIRSGSVFVCSQSFSGIQRWTDGISWSPSRVRDGFIVYQEVQRPLLPDHERLSHRQKHECSRTESRFARHVSVDCSGDCEHHIPDSQDRKMRGSLVKRNALLKKTFSIRVGDVAHRLIAYHTVEEARSLQNLFRPGHDPRLAGRHPLKGSLGSRGSPHL